MKTAARFLGRLALSATLAIGFWGCSKPTSEAPLPAPQSAATGTAKIAETPAFTVTQETSGPYTPGATVTVKTTMNYTGTEPVTALALQTKLPQAWRYGGTSGDLKPAIDPQEGTTGLATLIWIQIPTFPATVTYTLDVPDWTEGTHTLSCKAIYRTLGDELTSPIHELPLTGEK